MKTFTLLALLALASISKSRTLSIDELSPADDDGCFLPNSEGTVEWLTPEQEALELKNHTEKIADEDLEVYIYLFTKQNHKEPQELVNTNESIQNSNFDGKRATRLFIHGWMGSLTFPSNTPILHAWLETGDYNILMLDWGKYAQMMNFITMREAIPGIGRVMAEFLHTLHTEFGMSYETLHVVGHSMGTLLSGIVAQHTIQLGHKIGNIVALDPTTECSASDTRLHHSDAVYVESIHTSTIFDGIRYPIGSAAFYVNGAGVQPMCQTTMWSNGANYLRSIQYMLQTICSHTVATTYYANALRCQSRGMVCENYATALEGDCEYSDKVVLMGATRETGEQNAANTPPGLYYIDESKSKALLMGECRGGGAAQIYGFTLGSLLFIYSLSYVIFS